jgi:hypothetical protein
LSPQQQFHSYAENRQLEPHVEFPVIPAEGDEGEEMNTGLQTVTLSFDELKDLESLVNDPKKRKCVVNIDKVVPSVGDDPKAKAAKGKGAAEEAKPIFGEATLDLVPFLYPGAATTVQRCFISTLEPPKQEVEAGSQEPASAGEEPFV